MKKQTNKQTNNNNNNNATKIVQYLPDKGTKDQTRVLHQIMESLS